MKKRDVIRIVKFVRQLNCLDTLVGLEKCTDKACCPSCRSCLDIIEKVREFK